MLFKQAKAHFYDVQPIQRDAVVYENDHRRHGYFLTA